MGASTFWPVQTFAIEDDDRSAIPRTAEVAIRHAETKDDGLQRCEFMAKPLPLMETDRPQT